MRKIIFSVLCLTFVFIGILRADDPDPEPDLTTCIDPYNANCELDGDNNPNSEHMFTWLGVKNTYDYIHLKAASSGGQATLNLSNSSDIKMNVGGAGILFEGSEISSGSGVYSGVTYFNMINSTFNMDINNNPDAIFMIKETVFIHTQEDSNFFVGKITNGDRNVSLGFTQTNGFSVINQINLADHNQGKEDDSSSHYSKITSLILDSKEADKYSMTINGAYGKTSLDMDKDGIIDWEYQGNIAIAVNEIQKIELDKSVFNVNGDIIAVKVATIAVNDGSKFNFNGDNFYGMEGLSLSENAEFNAKEGSTIYIGGAGSQASISSALGTINMDKLQIEGDHFQTDWLSSSININTISRDPEEVKQNLELIEFMIETPFSTVRIGTIDLRGQFKDDAASPIVLVGNSQSDVVIDNLLISDDASIKFDNFYGTIKNIVYDNATNLGYINIGSVEGYKFNINNIDIHTLTGENESGEELNPNNNLKLDFTKGSDTKEGPVLNIDTLTITNGADLDRPDDSEDPFHDVNLLIVGDGASVNMLGEGLTCVSNCSSIIIESNLDNKSSTFVINNVSNEHAVDTNINSFTNVNITVNKSYTSAGTFDLLNSSFLVESLNGNYKGINLKSSTLTINGDSKINIDSGDGGGDINIDDNSKFIINGTNVFDDDDPETITPTVNIINSSGGDLEINDYNAVHSIDNSGTAVIKGSNSTKANVEKFTNSGTLDTYDQVNIITLDSTGTTNVHGTLLGTDYTFEGGLINLDVQSLTDYGSIATQTMSLTGDTMVKITFKHSSIFRSGGLNEFDVLRTNDNNSTIVGVDYEYLTSHDVGGLDVMPPWLYYEYGKTYNNGSAASITCERDNSCNVYGDLDKDGKSDIEVISSISSSKLDSITFIDKDGNKVSSLDIGGETYTIQVNTDNQATGVGVDKNGDGVISDDELVNFDLNGDGVNDSVADIISGMGNDDKGEHFWIQVQRISNFGNLVRAVPGADADKAIYDIADLIDGMVASGSVTDPTQDIINSLDFNSGCGGASEEDQEEIYKMHNDPNYKFDISKTPCLYNVVDNIRTLKPIDNEVFIISSVNMSNKLLDNLVDINRQYYRLGEAYSWFADDISFSRLDDKNFVSGYQGFYNVSQAGVTATLLPNINTTASIGVTTGQMDSNSDTYNISVFGIALGGSLSYINESYFFTSALAINNLNFDNSRNVLFLNNEYSLNREEKAKSLNSMFDISLAFELGTEYSITSNTYIIPKVFSREHFLASNGFEESGSSASLTYDPISKLVLDTGVGLDLYQELLLPEFVGQADAFWYPSFKLNALYRSYKASSTNVVFKGYSDKYMLSVNPGDYSGLLLNLSTSVAYERSNISFIFSYDLDLGQGYTNNTLSGLFKYSLN